ncbi:MAG: hypothetical protein PVSMB7_00800 [Chloroflexota bacterium]
MPGLQQAPECAQLFIAVQAVPAASPHNDRGQVVVPTETDFFYIYTDRQAPNRVRLDSTAQ